MKIFLAGVPGAGSPGLCRRERELNKIWKDRLWTYYWLIKNNGIMPEVKNKKVELFLDSGAYSAKTQGIEVNLNEYIQFIKDNKEVIDVYANLDVIGSAQGTWKNHNLMVKAGLNPMPVFHYGEDKKWLKMYLD